MSAISIENTWLDHVLDRAFPNRKQAKLFEKRIQQLERRKQMWEHLIVGGHISNMGDLASGEWVEVCPGLMTRETHTAEELTILDGRSISDVELIHPHCHTTEDGPKNEVFFIIEGAIEFCIHDGETDIIKRRERRSVGEMMPLYPHEWHTVKMDKGTVYKVIIFPRI